MTNDDSPPIRPPTWLSLLTAATVAVALLTVTLVTQGHARTIDRLADVLQANAVPSIEHLTAARGALRRMTIALRDLVRDPDARRQQDREAVGDAERKLDEEMSAYIELPSFPGERAQNQITAKYLGVLERIASTVIEHVDEGDLSGARRIMMDEVAGASDLADDSVEDLVRLNANEASRTSVAIRAARLHSTHLSYLLHALAGALVLFVLVAVSKARRSYERLVEERAALESERKQLAERRAAELDMFAARVAHDLKSPLGAIGLSISLASRRVEHPDKVRSNLVRATKAVDSLTKIIDGLLTFARSAGVVSYDDSCANLGEVLKSALANVSAEAERTGVELSIDPVGSIWVACPPGPLLSVVGNLVGNAVKFIVAAEADARRIYVRAREENGQVRVEIEDNGPGIPSSAQAAIFEPYVRGPNATQPGLGLGLATVKRIVEAHGGIVGVRSVVGKGSCFWFRLPRRPPPPIEEETYPELH